ncbi:MAG TPA: hypothetical protein VFS30_17885 [Dehalococcoidia bacterium]|nr:hypothetical protein [Dehalococcoidia bacterium]
MTGTTTAGAPSLTPTRLIFAYALGFTIFDLVPIPLSDVGAFKGLSVGDLVDAPLIILPAALLFRMALDADLWRAAGLRAAVLLTLLLFAQGHAVHLTANAIAHSLAESDAAWESAYFLDEHLGHYELQVALLIFATLFIWFGHPSRLPRQAEFALLAFTIAGYGSLQAAGAIEGQTVPLVLPASLILATAGIWAAKRRGSEYTTFFAASYAVCFLVLVTYGAANNGWPEIL